MRWYVLRSKPNKEEALWNELCARGFDGYYPFLRVKPVNPRSKKNRPYFPGYLFVRTQLADVGESVFNWLPYSSGLVSFDGQPAEVPEGLVERIRRRVDQVNAAGGEQLFEIEKGETVMIQGGPFAGYKAIFDARLAGAERVRVLLKLLQVQQMKLDLPTGMIQRVKRR